MHPNIYKYLEDIRLAIAINHLPILKKEVERLLNDEQG